MRPLCPAAVARGLRTRGIRRAPHLQSGAMFSASFCPAPPRPRRLLLGFAGSRALPGSRSRATAWAYTT
jgi:hypothetical protein